MKLTWIIAALCAVAVLNAAELPELAKAEAWNVRAGDEAGLQVAEEEGYLRMTYSNTPDKPVQLLLKEPFVLGGDEELVWCATMRNLESSHLHLLVEDGKGNQYAFHTASAASLGTRHKGSFLGGQFGEGLEKRGEARFRAPALKKPNRHYLDPLQKNTPVVATPPFKVLGLQLAPTRPLQRAKENAIYLRKFARTKIDRTNTAYYYQFSDEPRFVELDGPPTLSLADLNLQHGRKFIVDWELRNSYAGIPILTGGKIYTADPGKSKALELNQTIELPQPGPGTYWIRVKLRWSNHPDGRIEKITERDYRLYVISGDGISLPAAAESGAGNIRIGGDRKELIWKRGEKWDIPVSFPARESTKGVLRALDSAGKELLKKEVALKNDGAAVEFDLSSLSDDLYMVEASEYNGGKLLDQVVRMVGREPEAADKAAGVPPGTLTAREIIDSPEPLFQLMPQTGNKKLKFQRTMEYMRVTPPISKQMEYQFPWSEIEPLPGIYDFSRLDAVLAEAQKQGFTVLLWPAFDFPEWVPSSYTQNDEGEIFGGNSYLFHGARLNLFFDPSIRDAAHRMLRQLVLHARSNPAVQGYYILQEHPGEIPYIEWYEGFDPFTIAAFREFAREKYQDIGKANAAWRTKFASFETIMPPRFQDEVVPMFRVDWLRFRLEAIRSFLLKGIQVMRETDPVRLLMLYGDGVGLDRQEDFAKLNVMTANGGCHVPEHSSPGLIRVAMAGLPQRAEEVTVTSWAAYPYQLDSSFFSMLMGGGSNTSCKMFISMDTVMNDPKKSFDSLRRPPKSLDRYELFMPLWRELRGSTRTGDDIRFYMENTGRLVETKTNFATTAPDTWMIRNLFDAQLGFAVAPMPGWEQAKLVLLLHRSMVCLPRQRMDELEAYVRNGGTVVMNPGMGRLELENPDEDWVLLRRFGFNPPAKDRRNGMQRDVTPVAGSIFPEAAKIGRFRDLYEAGSQPGVKAAAMGDWPAVTLKEYGKGKVAVLWSQAIIPPGENDPSGYPLLRSLAEWAGVKLAFESDSRNFWVNLLEKKAPNTWYVLVRASRPNAKEPLSSKVRLLTLPAGEYKVIELISKSAPVVRSAEQLKSEGLAVTLEPNQLAVFRLEKQ